MKKYLIVLVVAAVAFTAYGQSVDDLNKDSSAATLSAADDHPLHQPGGLHSGSSGQTVDSTDDNTEEHIQLRQHSRIGEPEQTPNEPPIWQTRQGVEEAAKDYFAAKAAYAHYPPHSAAAERAAVQLQRANGQLTVFEKWQDGRDRRQDERLNADHSRLNDQGAAIRENRNEVQQLWQKLDGVTADLRAAGLLGVDGRLNGLTVWVLTLTIIVIIGFSRRWRIR